MFKTILVLAMTLIIYMLPNSSYAKNDMDSYVNKKCLSGCVKPSVLTKAVKNASKTYKVKPNVILSIIATESGFRHKAKNSGNVGLMQVNLTLHKRKFKSGDYFNANSNISIGTEILKNCLDKQNGNMRKALICYNGSSVYPNKVIRNLKELGKYDLALK